MINLETPIEEIYGIGIGHREKLAKINIATLRDFLFHFPARYDDLSQITPIAELEEDQLATIIGTVTRFETKRSWKRKMTIIEVSVEDETGVVDAIWFNQKYLIDSFSRNPHVRLSGKVKRGKKGALTLSNPVYEPASKNPNHTGRIVPVYPETKGITSRWLRWQIENIFQEDFEITDPLPEEILKKYNLPSLKKALYHIHFPSSSDAHLVAQKRFAFFDMFLIQFKSLQLKKYWKKESSVSLKRNQKNFKEIIATLPFKLTADQKKALTEIQADLEKSHPMNRLLNGDVGSGKTIVAALAAFQVANNNCQISLMAPTEVLAYQHFQNLSNLFANFDISVGLLTNSYKLTASCHPELDSGSLTNKKSLLNYKKLTRPQILKEIQDGSIDIIIGTHALIQKDIRFKNLALIIIDEQHRFGVAQRAALQSATQTNAEHTQTHTETPLLYEKLSYKIRGAIFNVKKQLGLGHKEKIYQKALAEELKKEKIKFETEKTINIKYDGKNIGVYRPDFIIENKIILELKALPFVGKFEKQQVWHYLKASDYKLALLANFGRKDIEIERFIHTSPQESVSRQHKSVILPHFLSMTATPIPRTISMTLLGSLDVSLITQMPANRKPITTQVVLPKKQPQIYDLVRDEIKRGRQAFVILPLVEESEKLDGVKAVITEHERLSTQIFPDLKLGLLHGRMKSAEKEEIMLQFKNKEIDILVSTSVIEVGIDIPNATVMIVEEAYRFGLSQLHQFRGRVGRGDHQSYCFLFASQSTKRLSVLAKYSDGFKLAEEDLKLRGPGDFFGNRQSGLADATMANITNIKMIKFAHEEAKGLIKKDPELKKHPLLSEEIKKMNERVHLE